LKSVSEGLGFSLVKTPHKSGNKYGGYRMKTVTKPKKTEPNTKEDIMARIMDIIEPICKHLDEFE